MRLQKECTIVKNSINRIPFQWLTPRKLAEGCLDIGITKQAFGEKINSFYYYALRIVLVLNHQGTMLIIMLTCCHKSPQK
jgi:hypothetical protein